MRGRYLLLRTALPLAALALIGSALGGPALAKPPPGKHSGDSAGGGSPAKHPPRAHDAVSVGIAYRHGSLILSSAKAGPAKILARSKDGHHKFVASVTLLTPTTTLPLKKLFPKITKGRYRVVVLPGFKDGFLSGRWIDVH
jgi:hypothetical protein